ncbi:hypothetical protein AOG27_00885 [Pseudoalteromonas lipolytica]|uniref:Uncharacterized protein n=1 Tax=Pseudoalteromonas lipolytica TaxID=570156 RepID=A0A0P7EBJ0_9GAMM|nr:hypothetical protein AOG27_00885 [Pseudoalteromonas lipolytica]
MLTVITKANEDRPSGIASALASPKSHPPQFVKLPLNSRHLSLLRKSNSLNPTSKPINEEIKEVILLCDFFMMKHTDLTIWG